MKTSMHEIEAEAALWADLRRRGEIDELQALRLEAWLAEGSDRAALLHLHERMLADPALAIASARVTSDGHRSPALPVRPVWGAGLAAGALAAFLLWPRADTLKQQDFAAPAGAPVTASLDDGSTMRLNGDSRARTAFDAEGRAVFLTGEGFFDVARDSERPFSVITATHRVTALGTRFNVDERSGGVVEVGVLEGRVEIVSLKDPASRAVVEAGRRLTVGGASGVSATPRPLVGHEPDWMSGWIDADDMSLSDLLLELKRQSPGFDAALADPILGARRISGRFRTSAPDRVLEAVAETQGLQLTIEPSGRRLLEP